MAVCPQQPEALYYDLQAESSKRHRSGAKLLPLCTSNPAPATPTAPRASAHTPLVLHKYLLESICCNLLHASALTMLNV